VRGFFERVTQLVPDRADWWNNLGLFARDTEQYEKSYAAYEKAVELKPDSARFVNDKALLLFYHLNRNLEQAEADFKKAIELGRREFADAKEESKDDAFSAYTDAMVNLARLYHKQKRDAECRETVQALLQEAPGRPEALELRAEIEEDSAQPQARQ
jgi:tetratricopeptide (TPR) repeat protein